jgi:hypothetical protein
MTHDAPPESFSFTSKYNGKSNKLINSVLISLPDNTSEKFDHLCKPEFNALWDTGATKSVISENVVKACNLIPIGVTNCCGVSGIFQTNVYLVNVYLPNRVVIPNLEVTEGLRESKEFDMLVGMDVIGLGDFAVCNHKGITTFSFRFPSQESIDFVAKKPILNQGKVGRNDPCPCGSGKKFKKCCG